MRKLLRLTITHFSTGFVASILAVSLAGCELAQILTNNNKNTDLEISVSGEILSDSDSIKWPQTLESNLSEIPAKKITITNKGETKRKISINIIGPTASFWKLSHASGELASGESMNTFLVIQKNKYGSFSDQLEITSDSDAQANDLDQQTYFYDIQASIIANLDFDLKIFSSKQINYTALSIDKKELAQNIQLEDVDLGDVSEGRELIIPIEIKTNGASIKIDEILLPNGSKLLIGDFDISHSLNNLTLAPNKLYSFKLILDASELNFLASNNNEFKIAISNTKVPDQRIFINTRILANVLPSFKFSLKYNNSEIVNHANIIWPDKIEKSGGVQVESISIENQGVDKIELNPILNSAAWSLGSENFDSGDGYILSPGKTAKLHISSDINILGDYQAPLTLNISNLSKLISSVSQSRQVVLKKSVKASLNFEIKNGESIVFNSELSSNNFSASQATSQQFRDAYTDLTIQNKGSGKLKLLSLNMPSWLTTGTLPIELASGESKLLRLKHNTDSPGDLSGDITFVVQNADFNSETKSGTIAVSQSITEDAFKIKVTHAGLNYLDGGSIEWPLKLETGTSSLMERTITIQNLSNRDMRYTSSWLGSAWVHVIRGFVGSFSTEWLVKAGTSATITLQKSARTAGLIESTMKIKLEDVSNPSSYREIPIALSSEVIPKVSVRAYDEFNNYISSSRPFSVRGAAKDVPSEAIVTLKNLSNVATKLSTFSSSHSAFTIIDPPEYIEANQSIPLKLKFLNAKEETINGEISFHTENTRFPNDVKDFSFPVAANTIPNLPVAAVITDESGLELASEVDIRLDTLYRGMPNSKKIYTITNSGLEPIELSLISTAQVDESNLDMPTFNLNQITYDNVVTSSTGSTVSSPRPRVVPPAGSSNNGSLSTIMPGTTKRYSISLSGAVIGQSKFKIRMSLQNLVTFAVKEYNHTFRGATMEPITLSISSNLQQIEFINGTSVNISGKCHPSYSVTDTLTGGATTVCGEDGNFNIIAILNSPSAEFPSISLKQQWPSTGTIVSSVYTNVSRYMERIPSSIPLKDRAIIVYNKNVLGSQEIADYYADKRNIDTQRVCGVELPPGLYASTTELDSAFASIQSNCLCPLMSAETRPAPCGPEQIELIEAEGIADHFVFVRGIPARIFMEPTTIEDPAMGWYFRDNFFNRPDGTKGRSHLYYGNFEAVTPERTKNLLDRTLDAEKTGVEGTLLSSGTKNGNSTFMDIVNGLESADCMEIYNSDIAAWDASKCSFAANAPGEIPAGRMHPSGIVDNVGFYAGGNPWPNGQQPFNGSWKDMLSWRKNADSCLEICDEFVDPLLISGCKERSTDYFKVINTDCVGGSPSLIGFQLRSWPNTYYGFMPHGWMNFWSGDRDVTPVYELNDLDKAFVNERFSDGKYIRLGDPFAKAGATCNGIDCSQRIPLTMSKKFYFTKNLIKANGAIQALFKIRFKNSINTDKSFNITVYLGDSAGNMSTHVLKLDMNAGNSETWSTAELPMNIANANSTRNYNRAEIYLISEFANDIRGFVELDGLEVIDQATGESILPLDAGSFNEDQKSIAYGNTGSTMIDRLGAVAWWGSSSHWMTGGWAFKDIDVTAVNFFRGEGLGRSVIRSGGLPSGLFFGDPLYNPSAAALKLVVDGAPVPVLKGQSSPYNTVIRDLNSNSRALEGRYAFDASSIAKVSMLAFNGSDNDSSLVWSIEKCSQIEDPAACSRASAWEEIDSGSGAIRSDEMVFDSLMDVVENVNQPEIINLRLLVKKSSSESQVIQSQLLLKYKN